MAYKEILENATSAKSFSLNEDCLAIEDHVNSNITSSLKILKAKLPEKLYRYFKSAVIRSSFFIEPKIPFKLYTCLRCQPI